MVTFSDLNLSPLTLESLERIGYKEPTAIQAKAIPLIQEGHDVIALAQTGSGKTAACAIPVCDRVKPEHPHVQALIIVPTRELSLQYATEVQKIGRRRKVKAFAVLGGEDMGVQVAKLKHGVHVLTATPGRLIDLIYSRQIDLTQVETLILDEADEMLGMGFYEDLEFIINCLVHEHQTLLFSATMPKDIRKIAKHHMKNVREVTLTQTQASPQRITHQFDYTRPHEKTVRLAKHLQEPNVGQAIVFCNSRRQVERLCADLQKQQRGVDMLHGGFSQDLRTVITNKFRSGKVRVMVATDVAARGLDFSGVTHVFIYDLSADIDTYVHRSGRTGRHDRHGIVISLVTDRELKLVGRVQARIKREIEWLQAPPSKGAAAPSGGRSKRPPRKKRPSSGGGRGARPRKPKPESASD
jgi:ATP-dependent RNA helicase DeaD